MKLFPLYRSLLKEWGADRQDIEDAINDRRYVEIEYMDEHDNYTKRMIEPYVLGYNKKGNLVLRAYHYDGTSTTNDRPEWRMLRVDRIYSFNVKDEKFNTDADYMRRERPHYRPNDKEIVRVIAKIKPGVGGNLRVKAIK